MAKERNNKPRRVIIKQADTKLKVEDGYIEAHSVFGDFVVGLYGIDEIYLNKNIAISAAELFLLSKHAKVHLIDANGNILGRFKRYRYE